MNNFVKTPLFKCLLVILSVFAWFLIWELGAYLYDFESLFPGPIKTVKTLFTLVGEWAFWKSIIYTFCRIFFGLLIGIALGILLTVICRLLPFLRSFISIGMSVVKSTPVASFVLILYLLLDLEHKTFLPMIIAVMMVSPIIWQNLTDGFNSVDKNLLEVAKIFEFSKIKTAKTVYLPPLIKHFTPAVLSSIGLAWKAGVAAEVIAYTKNSIGKSIADAKSNWDGDILFAWTLVVIVISIALEFGAKIMLKRSGKKNASN